MGRYRDTLLDEAEDTLLQGVHPSRVLAHLLMTDAQFAAGWNTAIRYVYSGTVPCPLCVDTLRRRYG
jgi:hypothetical protein